MLHVEFVGFPLSKLKSNSCEIYFNIKVNFSDMRYRSIHYHAHLVSQSHAQPFSLSSVASGYRCFYR